MVPSASFNSLKYKYRAASSMPFDEGNHQIILTVLVVLFLLDSPCLHVKDILERFQSLIFRSLEAAIRGVR